VEGIGRIDWQINNNYKFFYRFSYDQNHSVLAIIPNSFQPFGNVNHTPVHAIGLDFNTGPTRTAFASATPNSAMESWTQLREPASSIRSLGIELAIGSDPDCLTSGADSFCSGPSFLAPQQTYQSDHQIKYDGSRALGAHIIATAADLTTFSAEDLPASWRWPRRSAAPLDSTTQIATAAAGLALSRWRSQSAELSRTSVSLGNGQGYDSEIPAFGFPAGGSGPDNRISLYVGDAWKLKPNFTLTYGLRYVRDSGRTDSDLGPISALNQFDNQYYSGLGNRVHQPNLNFAPQLWLGLGSFQERQDGISRRRWPFL
jgi:hypothetical protein